MTRDEIEVRNNERKQLLEFLPQVVDDYRAQDTDPMHNRADRLEDLLPVFDDEIDGVSDRYDIGAEEWELVATGLDSLDNTRAAWLRAKLARRARMPTIRMGFTTNTPAGTVITGEEPPEK